MSACKHYEKMNLAYFMDYENSDPMNRNSSFDCSPLSAYWGNPSGKAKGSFGERLYRNFVERNGYSTTKATNSGHDLIVNGRKVEVKLAAENTDRRFIINQVKLKGDYEIMVLILVEPNGVSSWVTTKEGILSLSGNPQHQNEEVMIVASKEEIKDVCEEINFSIGTHGLPSLTE